MKCFYATHGCLNQAESGLAICERCRPYSETSMAGAWRKMANAPQWTTEPPTEPGWYWRAKGGQRWIAHIEAFELPWSPEDDNVDYWQRIEAPEVPK